ncbi:hypothetical protein [Streptomyces indiaensis]|uniref:Uncharacterized protein n=1 Tax=Streptomyces indiaensis TaxID=284033 RepID=A0ABN3EC78_9ACTN|nr:hypothetical protein [Streptomyces indiaensis]MCF1648798.1 hypothetical protein [Streptomyces indiaensis]
MTAALSARATIREEHAEMLFGEDGLRLNIARYNIGGGNAPDVRKGYGSPAREYRIELTRR